MFRLFIFFLPFLLISSSLPAHNKQDIVTLEKRFSFSSFSKIQKIFIADTIPADGIFDEKQVDKKAEFKGGKEKWNEFITKKMNVHITEFGVMDYGVCILRFVVDAKGKVSKVEALTRQNTKLSEVLIDALTWGPKWIPAQKDGKPVKSYRTLDVTLRPPDFK
ncbi:MAG: hypothetical protein H3C36_04410 [Chitinophagaceae bacterium]|nr:hypothetical protein [Chitinophagaceae bacterium]MCW5914064.1 hypothetical protein [Chitinophagaceae bacterium]MCZ2396045.1 energy transducer TonB [Chitinophagales bacterium]